MPGNKNKKTDNDNTAMDFDIYNDDNTEEIVSGLFDEYIGKGSTNYFANYSTRKNNINDEAVEESSDGESDKNGKVTNKTMIFRKGLVEEATEPEPEAENELETELDDTESYDEAEDEAETEIDDDEDENVGFNLENTIILSKISHLSNLFKTDKNEEEEDDGYFSEMVERRKEREAEATAEKEKKANKVNRSNKPDKEDKVSVVSPKKKKKEPVEEKDASEAPKSRRRNSAEQEPAKPTKKVINFTEEADDDYVEEERVIDFDSIKGIILFASVTALVIIAILGYMVYDYNNELKLANDQISELQKNSSSTYETEIEELKKQIADLQAENAQLKGGENASDDPHTAAVEILSEAQSEIATDAPNANLSQSAGDGNTYTVKSGDTIWKISASLYGNGAEYKKILDANGLNENSTLNEGQVLKIPN